MDPYLGEIRLFGFGKELKGWHRCDGSLLPITANQPLYSLLGTTYGGDGRTTFGLPDLRGRAVMGAKNPATQNKLPYSVGNAGGAETVTLNMAQIPQHQHLVRVSSLGGTTATLPDHIYTAVKQPSSRPLYGPMSNPPVAIEPSTIQPAGGGQAHPNMQASLALSYYIATAGVYPQRD
ncbi:phage tail protein [Sphingomonas pokkalii]|uniref:Phage tail protein n=1 Tax=Sphingomonas pokkalii TaxID=2175090 RepID=A0A2U0S943_9SPHN|nr:tail fiber protein [Sphingomonas pokkalii]PVX27897.1 phage tail protein [Sphingomonas pokkalii]